MTYYFEFEYNYKGPFNWSQALYYLFKLSSLN